MELHKWYTFVSPFSWNISISSCRASNWRLASPFHSQRASWSEQAGTSELRRWENHDRWRHVENDNGKVMFDYFLSFIYTYIYTLYIYNIYIYIRELSYSDKILGEAHNVSIVTARSSIILWANHWANHKSSQLCKATNLHAFPHLANPRSPVRKKEQLLGWYCMLEDVRRCRYIHLNPSRFPVVPATINPVSFPNRSWLNCPGWESGLAALIPVRMVDKVDIEHRLKPPQCGPPQTIAKLGCNML